MAAALQRVVNFRDISGSFVVSDSKGKLLVVKRGKIFRSARPDNATDEDVQELTKTFGVKTILDLRTTTELKSKANSPFRLNRHFQHLAVSFEGTSPYYLEFQPVNAPVSKVTTRRFHLDLVGDAFFKASRWWVQLLTIIFFILGFKDLAALTIIRYGFNVMGLRGMNKTMLDNSKNRIREALRIVADPANHPVLIHCTHGKDRTGLVVALTEHILGYSEEQILADYDASNDGLIDEQPEMMKDALKYNLDPELFRAPPEVLRDTLAYIKTRYGSIDRYLDSIGFTETDRENMRHSLLTPKQD